MRGRGFLFNAVTVVSLIMVFGTLGPKVTAADAAEPPAGGFKVVAYYFSSTYQCAACKTVALGQSNHGFGLSGHGHLLHGFLHFRHGNLLGAG